MNHVRYGLFENGAQARAAMDVIEATGTPRQRCGVVLQEGQLDVGILGISETAAGSSAREGAAIAAALGALAGGIAGGPPAILAIGALSAMYGAVAGAIAGAASPDRRLESLAKEIVAGKVLLVVDAPSLASRDLAELAMRTEGARIEHKSFF